MAMDASGDSRCGIGARLRAGRERSGLSLLQAAEKLHVDAAVVEALENENFEALGATVFVRGHLRRYAELVKESPNELQDMYNASTRAAPPPDLTRIPKTPQPGDNQRTLAFPGLAVVVTVAIIGAVWWVLNNAGGLPELPTPPAARNEQGSEPNGTAAPATRSAPLVPSPVPAKQGNVVRNESSTPAPSDSARVDTAPAEPSAPPVAQSAAEAPVAATPETPGVASTETPTPAAEPAPERPRTSDLTLRFAADSWVEVYDSRGTRLFYDVGSADSVRTLNGSPPFRVVLGNAPGVALEVNGRPATVPKEAGPDGTVQFTINRSGRVSRPRNNGNGTN